MIQQLNILSTTLYKNLGMKVDIKSFKPELVKNAKATSNNSPLYPPNTINFIHDPINADINATTIPIIAIDDNLNFIFLNIIPETNPTAALTIINGEKAKFPNKIGANKLVATPTASPQIGPNINAINKVPIVSKNKKGT